MDSSKWKLNPLNIQNDLQGSRDSQYGSIYIKMSDQLSMYIAQKPDLFSTGVDAFQKSCRNPKGYAVPPFCLIRKIEKSSHRNGHNNSNNPSLPKPNLVFNSSTNELTISSSNPQNRRPFVQPKDSKTPSCNKQNTTVSG